MSADVKGLLLSEYISDIVVGKTGVCYILGLTGTTIADRDKELVTGHMNFSEEAKKNAAYASLAEFERMAVKADESSIGFYEYKGVSKIASHAINCKRYCPKNTIFMKFMYTFDWPFYSQTSV